MTHIDAVFEHGVFRPVEPINLPENTRVTVAVPGPALEELPDEQVMALANVSLSAADQEGLSDLLARNREGLLAATERDRLEELMNSYRRGLILKARATSEAVARGLTPRLNGDAA